MSTYHNITLTIDPL